MRQRFMRTDESGQDLRVRLDHVLRGLTPTQRIDLAMVLMAEGVTALRGRAPDASRSGQSPPPIEGAAFLKIEEAARRYPIGQRRLYHLVREGEIPSITLGRRLLVRAECIEEWLRKQEVTKGA